MVQRPKGKSKRSGPKNTDKVQSERFKETARRLGADESGEAFERTFRKVVPPRRASVGSRDEK